MWAWRYKSVCVAKTQPRDHSDESSSNDVNLQGREGHQKVSTVDLMTPSDIRSAFGGNSNE